MGHSNRVFCVKFNPQEPNMIVSGGWDRTIQIYDLRTRGPVNFLFGPHICGETIDFRHDGYTMVSGSYRMNDVLEVWDLRKLQRTKVIDWEGTGQQLCDIEEEEDSDENPATESATETEENKTMQSEAGQDSTSQASTQPTKAPRVAKKPLKSIAPFLYVAMFNKK